MTVFLCGFMGCGKSTIGRRLADISGRAFTDMDTYIEKKAGMSIPEIFEEKGESAFREMETEAVSELGDKGGIVACGGGAMLKDINAKIAAEKGVVVYIDVDFDTCYGRISGDKNRPIVAANTKESLEEIYNSRVSLYTAHSSVKINGCDTPESAARAIKAAVGL